MYDSIRIERQPVRLRGAGAIHARVEDSDLVITSTDDGIDGHFEIKPILPRGTTVQIKYPLPIDIHTAGRSMERIASLKLFQGFDQGDAVLGNVCAVTHGATSLPTLVSRRQVMNDLVITGSR